MKQFIQSITIILITLLLAFSVSLLFDVEIINSHISRKIIVWVLMLLVFFVGFMLVINTNKNKENS